MNISNTLQLLNTQKIIFSSVMTKILNKYFIRQSSSALYITGDKASTNFSVLTPYLDLGERLLDRDALEKNLKYRGYTNQIKTIEDMYAFYKEVEKRYNVADITRQEIAKRLNGLIQNKNAKKEDVAKYKTPASIAKKEIRILKDHFQEIEQITALKILNLPNVLHDKTPLQENEDFYFHLHKPTCQCQSHITLAGETIEYLEPSFVFLTDESALFEIASTSYFQTELLKNKFTQFSNSDFARSVVLEGCGLQYESKFSNFTLDFMHNDTNSSLSRDHIVGGASIYSFMAYFARHSVQSGYIPLKLFTIGRTYTPVERNEPRNLFNVTQSTGVQVFIATHDCSEDEDEQLECLIELVKKLYDPFGVHYKLSYLKCNQLEKSESLKVSVQMFSPHEERYVEVGNISVYEKFLSKRLLFSYSDKKKRKFFRVISGNILNVPRLLGCLMENNCVNNKNGIISEVLKEYIPV